MSSKKVNCALRVKHMKEGEKSLYDLIGDSIKFSNKPDTYNFGMFLVVHSVCSMFHLECDEFE